VLYRLVEQPAPSYKAKNVHVQGYIDVKRQPEAGGLVVVYMAGNGRKLRSWLVKVSSTPSPSLKAFAKPTDLLIRKRTHPKTSLRDAFNGLKCVQGAVFEKPEKRLDD